MDELDTQLAEELKTQKEGQEPEVKEPEKAEPGSTEPTKPVKEKKPEPKMFDEEYVKGLRAENARYRTRARDLEMRLGSQVPVQNTPTGYPYSNQPNQPPQAGPYYDPRVDDMLLNNKLTEIKADPYFSELFAETDPEGRTFEERLLETAIEKQWPIDELDALVFKMEKAKILGKSRQKAIDETYKSLKEKQQGSADKNVSSGKGVEEGEVETVDDAIKKAMKENGVTDLSSLSG